MSKKEVRRIHVVGAQESNYPWGFENKIIKALEQMGHVVISTDFRKRRLELASRLMIPADLVLVCKGEGILPDMIRTVPAITALWYAEQIGSSDAIDAEAENRRRELALNVAAFDYAFSHDAANLQIYRQLGAKRVDWLPTVAIDPEVHKPLGIKKIHDVTFVGMMTPRRVEIIDELSKYFSVCTPQSWEPGELNKLFNQSKIALNIHLSDLPNTETRIGEILGAGTFLLSEKLSSLQLLREGVHYVSVACGDVEAMIRAIEYYLQHDDEREKIARQGHEHMLKNHTMQHRLAQLLATIDFSLRSLLWPSDLLGVLFNAEGRATLRMDEYYDAVAAQIG